MTKKESILDKQKFERIEPQFCPVCEVSFFITNTEMVKHLAMHERLEDVGGEVLK